MRKPNLFLIGAMKSGTTTLNRYLGMHPDIFMSAVKEPGFFVDEFTTPSRNLEWYMSLFSGAGNKRYCGESSTHYTKQPTYKGVAQRIHEFNPEARLVYIMRHPFERTISHYWHAVRDVKLGRERRNIIDAIKSNNQYVAYSDYAMQIREYLRFFGPNSIYCLTFESLLSNPERELRSLFTWLGIEPVEFTSDKQHALNQRPEEFQKVAGFGVLNAIRYSDWWAPISKLVPRSLRQLASSAAYSDATPRMSSEERNQLVALLYGHFDYQGMIQNLESLLGRPFTEWDRP